MSVCGHLGDGNLHISIMKREESRGLEYAEKVRKEIYEAGVKLGGVITGEQGIGKIRTEQMRLVLGSREMELMKMIKRLFDPNNILNPGKVLPS